ncbi:unnamed protein product [Ambrosiozyma monospora]|uniref:Unnamed protein product n=1 Tax=Ambrosiozyma monospora TaxID=43982 RepID=A0A9W6YSZ4_AMBMO|nr:unnamed protein product [Ambrosiozyma monospora]
MNHQTRTSSNTNKATTNTTTSKSPVPVPVPVAVSMPDPMSVSPTNVSTLLNSTTKTSKNNTTNIYAQVRPNNSPNPNKPHHNHKSKRFKGKPIITEVPELLELCTQFIASKNVTGLAMIARQRGLPPALRYKIWPILLKYHPFVQSPFIEPDEEDEDDDEDNEEDENGRKRIPIDQIKFDLRKYLRNAERYKPKVLTSELKDLFEIQDKIFEVILNAIVKFLKKWGTIVNYNSGLTWIALGLAEWVPPLPNSQFVLCGKDDVAKNGTKLRNVYDSYFEKMEYTNGSGEYCSSLNSASSFNSAINTPSQLSTSPNSVHSYNTTSNSSSSAAASTNSSSNDYSLDSSSYPFKPMSFAEVFERMVLVILHVPDPSKLRQKQRRQRKEKEKQKQKEQQQQQQQPSTSSSQQQAKYYNAYHNSRAKYNNQLNIEKRYTELPKNGGSIEDRISFFLYCFRKLLPELHKFLSDEDCLKGDWLIWWLKYCGSKVFSRYDRSRVWDLLLGYRVNCYKFEKDLSELNELSDVNVALLGPDIFWNPLDLDSFALSSHSHSSGSTSSNGSDSHGHHSHSSHHNHSSSSTFTRHRSSSIKTLLDHLSITTPTLSSINPSSSSTNQNADVEPIKQLPYSEMDPHVQFIFIALAFLKSKEFAIMELDQSDIKQLLSNVSSLRTSEFKSIFGSSNNTNNTNNNSKSVASTSATTSTPVSTAPGSVYAGSVHSSHSAPSAHSAHSVSSTAGGTVGVEQQSNLDPHSALVTPTSAPLSSTTTNAYDPGSTTRSITSSEASFCGSAVVGVSASGSAGTGNGNGTGAGSAAYSHHLHHQSKKSNRDIENIIVEAGELWRKFAYMESIEEEDED